LANEMKVSKLEAKSHNTPDELRAPSKTRVEVVRLQGFTLGRFIFQPGWRWSECIKPVAKTDSCQAPRWLFGFRSPDDTDERWHQEDD